MSQVGAEVGHWLRARGALVRALPAKFFFFFFGGGGGGGTHFSPVFVTVSKIRFSQESAFAQEIPNHEFLNIRSSKLENTLQLIY